MSTPPALKYARLLNANVLEWYKAAEIKAQVILTLNGLFLGITTGALFAKRSDLSDVIRAFPQPGWTLFLAMCACIAASLVSAVAALSSQLNAPAANRDEKAYTERDGIKVG